jgi:hypothetical protein
MGREVEWGGQLGLASWGWLQSPFFIVCLNQGHFFLSLFSSISMIFFKLFYSKYHGERGGEWGRIIQDHESPNKSLSLSLPGSYQNFITYWSQIQHILVHPGRCDGPIVPNPKTPRGDGFLKVGAKFQT